VFNFFATNFISPPVSSFRRSKRKRNLIISHTVWLVSMLQPLLPASTTRWATTVPASVSQMKGLRRREVPAQPAEELCLNAGLADLPAHILIQNTGLINKMTIDRPPLAGCHSSIMSTVYLLVFSQPLHE
jgi:hypothetical protein